LPVMSMARKALPITCSEVRLPDRFCGGGPRKVVPAPPRIESQSVSSILIRACGSKVEPTDPP